MQNHSCCVNTYTYVHFNYNMCSLFCVGSFKVRTIQYMPYFMLLLMLCIARIVHYKHIDSAHFR